jgi:sugar phosphate isomerase/epimerase
MSTPRPDLIAGYWTVAGDADPFDAGGHSPVSFPERAQAAASAGYVGFGLDLVDLTHVISVIGLGEVKRILADCAFRYIELEKLRGWFATGATRSQSNVVRSELLRIAGELGVCHVKVGGDAGGDPWPISVFTDEFGRLCEDFAAVGTRVVLEPMPFSNIATLDEAVAIVGNTARSNGGIVLDVWHLAHMESGYDAITRLPAETLGHVELNDGDQHVTVSMLDDTANRRKLCGEGDLDVPGFLQFVEKAGYQGAYGVEILSLEHRRLPVQEQASRSFTSALAQFASLEQRAE